MTAAQASRLETVLPEPATIESVHQQIAGVTGRDVLRKDGPEMTMPVYGAYSPRYPVHIFRTEDRYLCGLFAYPCEQNHIHQDARTVCLRCREIAERKWGRWIPERVTQADQPAGYGARR